MKAGSDRPVRNVEDACDLGKGQAGVVMEHDDGAMVRRQLAEGSIELVAQIRVGKGVQAGGERFVDLDLADAGSAGPTRLEEAEPHDEAVGPRFEAVDVPQARQVTPHRHERLLDGVVGAVGVPNDPVCGRVEALHGSAGQQLVGLAISPLGSGDQILIHVRRLIAAQAGPSP